MKKALSLLLGLALILSLALPAAAGDTMGYTVLVEPLDEWYKDSPYYYWTISSKCGSGNIAVLNILHYEEESTGHLITREEYRKLMWSDTRVVAVDEYYLAKAINGKIEFVTDAYDYIDGPSVDGYFTAKKDNIWYVIDNTGAVSLELGEVFSALFTDDGCVVAGSFTEDPSRVIDLRTKQVVGTKLYLGTMNIYNCGVSVKNDYDENGRYCSAYYDLDDNIVLGPYYDLYGAFDFHHGYAVLGYKDGTNQVIDRSGNVIFTDADKDYHLELIGSGRPLIVMSKDGYIRISFGEDPRGWNSTDSHGYVNVLTGETILLPKEGFSLERDFQDGYGMVYSTDDDGLYPVDRAGNIIKLEGMSCLCISDTGVAWVKDAEGRIGVIQLTGGAAQPEPTPTPQSPKVVLSAQNLSVNGKNIACEKYNIDGSNYFKLRDLAKLLDGTGSQFDVGWDGEKGVVSITTSHAYTTPNGTELVVGADQSATAQVSAQTIMIDGQVRSDLTVYNIGGSNFFKLREMGDALGFDVDYDSATNTAIVNSR